LRVFTYIQVCLWEARGMKPPIPKAFSCPGQGCGLLLSQSMRSPPSSKPIYCYQLIAARPVYLCLPLHLGSSLLPHLFKNISSPPTPHSQEITTDEKGTEVPQRPEPKHQKLQINTARCQKAATEF